jgi:hypothetical protein
VQSAHAAAGAQNQHRGVLRRELQAALNVTHEADAVGVVAEDGVAVELQRVDRAGQSGARRELIGQLGRIELERDGDIEPCIADIAQAERKLLEAVERRQQLLVGHLLATLVGEQRVDLRRQAVLDRVADDGIARDGRRRGDCAG